MGQDADMSGPEVTSVLEKFQVFYDALDEREQLICRLPKWWRRCSALSAPTSWPSR
jgi:hypothetical protein